MQQKTFLLIVLVGLTMIGAGTIQNAFPADQTGAARTAWGLFLVLLPLALACALWMGWTWAAMACVVYGTIGLALDLATATSILGGHDGIDTMLAFSGMSGLLNLLLIIFGGLVFWNCLQGLSPRVSHPPSPPSPSSS